MFVERWGDLVSASKDGQVAIRELLDARLERVDRDPAGRASRLYPFTRKHEARESLLTEPRSVMIDPDRTTRVDRDRNPHLHLADRCKAGDSIAALARDYDQSEEQIQEAIRCELPLPTAA